ncbi:hypothetical protein Q5H93_14605 [Hymenobacter sp. ASUV-10]|uniref:DUF2335 domain-containing protein n=1 Tax=Hymenobacter aranciens TaxID=3063996 RepID=A0ABT9BCP3_9BACT|nr:hypothetical protein [Hymenobacter sp. ASUV-10]MDO7875972.1 hypothetical protein [Hymenobacter sp. ASUV-10]
MKYRESYAKKKAVQMYWLNQSREAVMAMLVEEGAGEQAPALADDYYRSYQFIKSEQAKQKRKAAGMYLTVGIVILVLGLGFMVITYIELNQTSFTAPIGILMVGIVAIIKGLRDRMG